MQGVILTAGKGSRLLPLTKKIPKGLVNLNGKPILEHLLDNLKGVSRDITFVIGHKGDMIREYFGNKYKNITLNYSEQKKQIGTANALYSAYDNLKEGSFFFLMGDNYYSNHDLKRLIKFDYACLGKTISEKEFEPGRFGHCIVKNNYLRNLIEKPYTFVSDKLGLGAYVIHKSDLIQYSKIKKSNRGEYEFVSIINRLITNENIRYVPLEKEWLAIDSFEDINNAEKILNYKS